MKSSQFKSNRWLTALVSVTFLVASLALFVADSQAQAPDSPPDQVGTVGPDGVPVVPLSSGSQASAKWKAEYFANNKLKGKPALVRNDVAIDFNWGTAAPAPGLPADNFSVRWTQWMPFAGGTYRFCVTADDGVRVEMDDQKPFIRQWHDGQGTYCSDVAVSNGFHKVRIEYYEHTGQAQVHFWWEQLTWKGEYFANRKLSDKARLVRNDWSVDFNWGTGAPASGLPADDFSVRWTRRAYFTAGTYRFCVKADDGVRVEMDDKRPFIREWHDGIGTYCADVVVTQGLHKVRVEYFEHTGQARVKFWWAKL